MTISNSQNVPIYILKSTSVARHALALTVSNGPLAIPNAFSKSPQPLAHKNTKTLSLSAVAVASWFAIATRLVPLTFTHAIAYPQAQRAQKLHPR